MYIEGSWGSDSSGISNGGRLELFGGGGYIGKKQQVLRFSQVKKRKIFEQKLN